MSAASQDNAARTGAFARAAIYAVLILFAVYYLLPLYVMLVNSLKPLDEIRQGNMLALPHQWTIEPWLSAWSTAQIGVQPIGLRPYFLNSVLMVVPAVFISTVLGALNGYVLTKWRFRGDALVFGLMLLACFIPFQIVLIPSARILGLIGLAGTVTGLVLIHAVYGLGFTTLFFRNYYEAFPTELVRAAQIDGASLLPDLSAHPAALLRTDHRGHRDLAVHQHLERFPVRVVVLQRRFDPGHRGAQQSGELLDRGEGVQRPFRRGDPGGPAHPRRLHRLRTLLRARSDGRRGQGVS